MSASRRKTYSYKGPASLGQASNKAGFTSNTKTSKRYESEKLEQETIFMETELKKLKEQVERQRVKTQTNNGNTHWRSAARHKGSLRGYAGDVKGRNRGDTSFSNGKKSMSVISTPTTQLRGELCPRWTIIQVCKWLGNIGLEQYKETFRNNEISGQILLELGVDDLDYLNIKPLAHRKLLLKEIDSLKNHITVNSSEGKYRKKKTYSPQRDQNRIEHEGKIQEENPSLRMNTNQLSPSNSGTGLSVVYESNLKSPASESDMVSGSTKNRKNSTTISSCNMAEGSVDEEKEHQAFRLAVEEWRKSCGSSNSEIQSARMSLSNDCKTVIKTDNSTGIQGSLSARSNKIQFQEHKDNEPRAYLRQEFNEQEEHLAFKQAVESWRKYTTKPNEKLKIVSYRDFKSEEASRLSKIQQEMLMTFENSLKKSHPPKMSVSSVDETAVSRGPELRAWDFENAY